MGDQASGQKPQPRINTRKLASILLLGLILPVAAALVADFIIGTLPYITVAAVVVCFPVAAILISRTALRELDRVIQEVAPSEIETPPEPG